MAPTTAGPGGNGREMTWTRKTRAARKCGTRPNILPVSAREDAVFVRATTEARIALCEAATAAEEAAARARSLAELLDEALVVLTEAEGTTVPELEASYASRPGADDLSSREREVLALVAEGRTNKAIAEALFVSPNTVKTHVASLLHKLQAETRAQLAAIATTQELRQRSTPVVP
jgi:DNA-binding NarL/FixJ family response regulator